MKTVLSKIFGHRMLRPSAISAAFKAKFKPTKLDGVPVEVAGVIVYNFGIENPLISASKIGNLKKVKELIESKEDVNQTDGKGVTSLMLASFFGYESIVDLLLANGADVNILSNDGETALMLAASGGNIKITKILIKNGADLSVKNKDGLNAKGLAVKYKNRDIEQYFSQIENRLCRTGTKFEKKINISSELHTGVEVKEGDKITFDAEGSMLFGTFAGTGGPEGISGYSNYSYVRNAPHGGLLARIRQSSLVGDWIYVGKNKTLTSAQDGVIEQNINDTDKNNNRGYFTVEITVCSS